MERLKDGSFPRCSITRQVAGLGGDLGAALQSGLHGDPETPLLEAYQGERILFRLIQGAQEVQHVFGIAGQPCKRNVDQPFAAAMQPLGESAVFKADPSLQQRCRDREAALGGHPHLRVLHRPANLEDLFLKLTGRKIREDG